MWREDSKHAVGFSFPRVAGDTATKCSWGFYCGPFCKTVRFSLLVIMAAIQKERKDRGSVLSGLVCYLLSMTISPEMVGEVNMEEWLRANVEWLKKEFGSDNLLR